MMVVKPQLKCEGCIRPAGRRLALFQKKDEYECYAESYVKCFWGLCDQHKSDDALVTGTEAQLGVVTEQPKPQEMPYRNFSIINDICVKKIEMRYLTK